MPILGTSIPLVNDYMPVEVNAGYLVSPRLLALGHASLLPELLTHDGAPELSSRLKLAIEEADFSEDISVAINAKDWLRKLFPSDSPLAFIGDSSFNHNLIDILVESDAAIILQIRCDKHVNLKATIICTNPSCATKLKEFLETDAIGRNTPPLHLLRLISQSGKWSVHDFRVNGFAILNSSDF